MCTYLKDYNLTFRKIYIHKLFYLSTIPVECFPLEYLKGLEEDPPTLRLGHFR